MAGVKSPVQLTALMCLAETLSMGPFAAFTTLLPLLQQEWGMTNAQAGGVGGIFYAGYMCSVPILSSLTDRMDSRRVYGAACLLSTIGALGFAFFAQGPLTAGLFQIMIGAALGGTYMPGLKTLADQLDGKVQSRAVAFYTAAFGLGSSISILMCGKLGAIYGWQTAFAVGAVGPVLAAILVFATVPAGRVNPAHLHGKLLDFRPVLRNRATVPYIIGYAVHNYELFGARSWMVAFLVFCAALQSADAPMLASAATLAAMVNLLGPVFSISGNELALRFGRSRIIFIFMTLSGLIACCIGYTAALPWYWVVVFMCVHYACMLGDSGAMTAGAVASTPPELRGSMMAVYSFIGFSAAFLAPFVFGLVLDLAGGNRSTMAWGLAFGSIGIFGLMAPLARLFWRNR